MFVQGCHNVVFNRTIPRLQSEGCLSSCWHWEQLAWSYGRRGRIARGISILPFCMSKMFLLLFKTAPLFSLFSLSWGRQEDNFGQIHQLRQQQQQQKQQAAYAWPQLDSQWAFSLSGWLGWTPSITWRGLFARIYRVWKNVLSAILCSPLDIGALQKSSLNEVIWKTPLNCHLNEFLMSYLQKLQWLLIKMNFIKNSATCIYHGWAYEPSRPVLLIDRKT